MNINLNADAAASAKAVLDKLVSLDVRVTIKKRDPFTIFFGRLLFVGLDAHGNLKIEVQLSYNEFESYSSQTISLALGSRDLDWEDLDIHVF